MLLTWQRLTWPSIGFQIWRNYSPATDTKTSMLLNIYKGIFRSRTLKIACIFWSFLVQIRVYSKPADMRVIWYLMLLKNGSITLPQFYNRTATLPLWRNTWFLHIPINFKVFSRSNYCLVFFMPKPSFGRIFFILQPLLTAFWKL